MDNRATGRTFRTCLEAMKTCSESKPDELTVIVSAGGRGEAFDLWCVLRNFIAHLSGVLYDQKSLTIILPGNRKLRSISVGQCQSDEILKNAHAVIYNHTVSADNEIIDGILSMTESIPKSEPTKPVIVVIPGFRAGKSFVYEALKMQAQAGLIDLESRGNLPMFEPIELKSCIFDEFSHWPNKPFYRKSRW